jgi:predicted ATPase
VPRPLRLERSFERDSAIATLSSQFSRKRLISLAEPAGWTSVALAIACTLVTHFDDALCFVDLADIDDPAQVEMAVAFALGCEVTLQQSRSGVLAYLQNKELLLVFDNCDHVLAGVAQLTERLFTAAPLVHILVNSHQTFRLSHLARGDTRSVAPVSA